MTRSHVDVRKVADLAAVSEMAAALCVERSAEAVSRRGQFMVALPGGSTPRGLYELLASLPWRDRVDWTRWHVFWGDERMVAHDDPNSNFRLAHDALLTHLSIPDDQIHPVPTDVKDAASAAVAYQQTLRETFALRDGDWPRFDLVLLGMGSDGHVASLFPGSPTLEEQERVVTSSAPGTLPPPIDRVTLTLPTINAARDVAFLVAGAEKAEVLAGALAARLDLPAARVKPSDGVVHWLVDSAAAAALVGA